MHTGSHTREGSFRGKKAAAASIVEHGFYLQAVRTEVLRRLSMPVVRVSIEAVAKSVDIPVRTLQRRLSANDVTFRSLLNECRFEQALELLRDGRYSVAEVSACLGYSDPAHFARAFRRWSRSTPSDFVKP